MQSPGIDYGRGITNIDAETGIRYGVINQNEVMQAWADSSEGEYECSECIDGKDAEGNCNGEFDCEPISFTYDGDGYQCHQSADDTDIFILKSPFYTYAQFCSPCAPGAGYLMNWYKGKFDSTYHEQPAIETINIKINPDMYKQYAEAAGFPRVYAFGHDWFEAKETGKWVDCTLCNGTGYRQKTSVPDYEAREALLIASGFVVPFDDKRFVCNVCRDNHASGQIGKVKEKVARAPYPVFSVEMGELVNPE